MASQSKSEHLRLTKPKWLKYKDTLAKNEIFLKVIIFLLLLFFCNFLWNVITIIRKIANQNTGVWLFYGETPKILGGVFLELNETNTILYFHSNVKFGQDITLGLDKVR